MQASGPSPCSTPIGFWGSRPVALLFGLLLGLGCSQDVVLFDSSAPPPGGGGGGGVTRVSLTLTLVVDAADSAVARAVGWEDGRVPGAEVTVRRTTVPVSTVAASTDSLGTVRFDSLLMGTYEISALRSLTPAETAQLAELDRDVDAVAAGGGLTLSDSGANRSVVVLREPAREPGGERVLVPVNGLGDSNT